MLENDLLLKIALDDPNITQEYKTFHKLESIFHPEVRKHRNRQYEGKAHTDPIRFVHYTSADSALKIIKSKRVWMRNTTCMTDFREVQHGYALLEAYFKTEPRRTTLRNALEACHPGAFDEALKEFDSWWMHIQLSTYIASVSEHDDSEDYHGRLSMWRAFGGIGPRVAIVLKIPAISLGAEALNLGFSPVSYLTQDQAFAVLDQVAVNIDANVQLLKDLGKQLVVDRVFTMLLGAVTCLKHEGFREEREWRAIYSPIRSPSPLMENDVEVVAGVPQTVHKIPLDTSVHASLQDLDFVSLFDRLIVGPSQYPAAIGEAFHVALKAAGVVAAETKIFASSIPIRS